MADDLPTSDEFDLDEADLESDLELDKSGFASGPEPADSESIADGLEFDTAGFEPGLELDKSGFEPEPPTLHPAPPPGRGHAGPGNPSPPPGPASLPPRPPPDRPPGPRTGPAGTVSSLSPKARTALAIGGAVLFVAILAAMFLSDPAPAPAPTDTTAGPEQALEDGERAFHQGKWVEALEAFHRLRRFPTSDEAKEVRERGLEARAIKEIMEAEPSSATIRRLEGLSELFPDRPEVRERLGEVRKALSSGARAAPADHNADADAGAD